MKKLLSCLLFIFALFSGGFVISGKDIMPGSRAEAAQFKQVRALHILVPTESEAVRIRKEIVDGTTTRAEVYNNFTAAAKKYSKCPSGSSGGDLGWFKKGDMVPEFEKTAFEIPSGEVSQPVKTQFGWHLIYVISKK